MSQIVINPIHCFYWQIRFEDGFVLSKFDENGNELDFKKDIPASCWYEREGRPCIDFNKNIFEKFEMVHGRAVAAYWIPFTRELQKKIAIKQPSMRVELPENSIPYKVDIPNGFFAYVQMKINMKIGVTIQGQPVKGSGFVGTLLLGYIPRPGTESLGELNEIHVRITERKP